MITHVFQGGWGYATNGKVTTWCNTIMQMGSFHAQGIVCWPDTYLAKSFRSVIQRNDGLIMNVMNFEGRKCLMSLDVVNDKENDQKHLHEYKRFFPNIHKNMWSYSTISSKQKRMHMHVQNLRETYGETSSQLRWLNSCGLLNAL